MAEVRDELTFDLLYDKVLGKNYEILKRDLATGALVEFTEGDARLLLEQEAEKERFAELEQRVRETRRRLDLGP